MAEDFVTPDVRNGIPPSVLEPGPRTAHKPGWFRSWADALLAFAVFVALVAIVGTFAILVYLIASGRV